MRTLDDYLSQFPDDQSLDFVPYHVYLMSGREIVTYISELDDENYIILNPFRIYIMADNEMHLVPYTYRSTDEFTLLPKHAIEHMSPLDDDNIEFYKEVIEQYYQSRDPDTPNPSDTVH